MTFKKHHLQALQIAAEQSFCDRMIGHLRAYFPNQCKTLGESEILDAIEYGIDKCKSYRIFSERDVCKFVSLMFYLGRDFDLDPDIYSAAAILQTTMRSGSERVDHLYKMAKNGVGKN